MSLNTFINELPKVNQFDLAIKLTTLGLPIWNKFADEHSLTYRDSIVGMSHSVKKNLLKNTISAVNNYYKSNKVIKAYIKYIKFPRLSYQFSDPTTALQDSDWEIPRDVEKIFHAVKNLLDATRGYQITNFNEKTINIVINQAIDALENSKTLTEEEMKILLTNFKNNA